MCGIFGSITDCGVETATLQALAASNLHRGNRGFGYFATSLAGESAESAIFRSDQPYKPSLLAGSYAHNHLMLCHIRAATHGQHRAAAGTHPFESADLLLAHNGLLLNHLAFPAWQGDSGIDSEVIVNGIQHYLDTGDPIATAIAATVSQFDGQQACWLWHKQAQALYLWRVMSPIYIGRTATSFTFSSTTTAACTDLLAQGTIYRLKPITMAWETVGTFPYETPYLIA